MLNEAAKNIVKRIEDSKRKFSTEEDVRVICEHIFQEEFERIGLRYEASYEVQIPRGLSMRFIIICSSSIRKPDSCRKDFSVMSWRKQNILKR